MCRRAQRDLGHPSLQSPCPGAVFSPTSFLSPYMSEGGFLPPPISLGFTIPTTSLTSTSIADAQGAGQLHLDRRLLSAPELSRPPFYPFLVGWVCPDWLSMQPWSLQGPSFSTVPIISTPLKPLGLQTTSLLAFLVLLTGTVVQSDPVSFDRLA